ncbi:hypothetical protein SAMD00079811_48520 [Scytonema sp. HK-05]|nr:hypothetical protein NIES2130_34475 [Scytonema sp. HK-05]BAY47235.1 hypothetical protein SAMD00079811_48520 [Scytonema sp. HK-05]
MFVKYLFLLDVATVSRGYTDKTRLRGFKTLNFWLVRAGGLRLCSSELYSPKTFKTSLKETI